MKIRAVTLLKSDHAPRQVSTITISIRRPATTGTADPTPRTAGPAVAGALLAGLALSETLFHTRGSLTQTHDDHAKLRV